LAAFVFAILFLMLTAASAIAQSFGSAEQARAMLDRAVAALKSDKAKALREFNDADNKELHDRDRYVSCFNITDGNFIAAPSAMLGTDIRTFKVGEPVECMFSLIMEGVEGVEGHFFGSRTLNPK
jgi:hypothetical protein